MTLSQALVPSQSLLARALMILAGSLFIGLAAQVEVPMFPVPMTLQTLAILIVGFGYGARLGALTVLAYLAEGAAGLPVFAGGANGAAFAGPTAGFLLGFVAMAWIAGLAADRGVRRPVPVVLVGLIASALIYVPGVAWAMSVAGLAGFETASWGADNMSMVWQYYIQPFMLGDAVKAVIAAAVVTGGWALLSRRKA